MITVYNNSTLQSCAEHLMSVKRLIYCLYYNYKKNFNANKEYKLLPYRYSCYNSGYYDTPTLLAMVCCIIA